MISGVTQSTPPARKSKEVPVCKLTAGGFDLACCQTPKGQLP
jgi:hypothetical protein